MKHVRQAWCPRERGGVEASGKQLPPRAEITSSGAQRMDRMMGS